MYIQRYTKDDRMISEKIRIECHNLKLEFTVAEAKFTHVSLGNVKVQLLDVAALLHNVLFPIENLNCSRRLDNALDGTGIKYVHQLASYKRLELLKLKNFGRRAAFESEYLLEEFKLTLGMSPGAIISTLIEYNSKKSKKE